MFKQINIALLILTLAACEGPVGPEGAQGTQGVQGTQGIQGVQGAPGTANIQVVQFSLVASQFSNSASAQTMQRNMPEITTGVVQGGLVLAYCDLGSGATIWFAMPLVVSTSSTTATLTFAYQQGIFSVQILKNTPSSLASAYAGFLIKVVIIPPPAVARLNGVNLNDYQRVLQALDMP